MSKFKQNYFDTAHLKANLKQRSVNGGVVTIAAQISKFSLKFGSTAILARLLTPEDYGLIGMVTVVIGLVEYFKDLGLSTATIQRSQINHRQVSTLFWINLGVSLGVALIVAAFSPAIAYFYHEPRLTSITLALAINFVFGGLSIQHQALLSRQMFFISLAIIDIVSIVIGIVTAMITAYYGWQYWALVWMLLATSLSNTLGVWIACSWRPGLPSFDSGVASMLAFGGNLTGFGLVNYFSRNLDNLLIGRRWGSQQLGLYAQAYRLLLLPIQQINIPITSVALPTLASLQNEPEKYSRYYYQAILLITTLGMPVVGLMFACADQFILLMLGKQWLGAVPLFQCLMPAAFVGTFNVAPGWVYQSLGRAGRQLRLGVIVAFITTAVFVFSVQWGAMGVAIAYGISQPILMFIAVYYCYLGTFLKFKSFLAAIARPTIAVMVAVMGLMVMRHFVLSSIINLVLGLFVATCLYILFYAVIWVTLPGGKRTLLEIRDILVVAGKKSN